MKRNVARTACFALLLLALAAAAGAQDHRCVNPGLTGAWGYTETGTVLVPNSAPPPTMLAILAAAVGRYDFEADGTFTGAQYSSTSMGTGTVSPDTKAGTYTLNPDCTGTVTLRAYNAAGALQRISVWQIVLVDNATEMRGIMTSMTLPNGVPLSPIMTFTAKRLFRDQGNEHVEK